MTTQTEALKMALEALQSGDYWKGVAAVNAIKEALAQPGQEPVVFWDGESRFVSQKTKEWDKRTGGTLGFGCDIALYTAPPQPSAIARSSSATPLTWVGLTKEDMDWLHENTPCIEGNYGYRFIKYIEAKLKAKNERLEKNT